MGEGTSPAGPPPPGPVLTHEVLTLKLPLWFSSASQMVKRSEPLSRRAVDSGSLLNFHPSCVITESLCCFQLGWSDLKEFPGPPSTQPGLGTQ